MDHDLRVPRLMIVGSSRKWNQQRRLARGGKFSDRGRAAARHDQMRMSEAGGHVVQKRLHLPACGVGAAVCIGCLGGLGMANAALVNDGKPGNRIEKRPGDLRQGLVEKPSALRTTENEKPWRQGRRRRYRKKLGTDGNTRNLGVAKPSRRGGKIDSRTLNALADEPV